MGFSTIYMVTVIYAIIGIVVGIFLTRHVGK